MSYRLINHAYTSGIFCGVEFQPAVIDGVWVGVADVEDVPERLPAQIRVVEMESAQTSTEPVVSVAEAIKTMKKDELIVVAEAHEIDPAGKTKDQLIEAILAAQPNPDASVGPIEGNAGATNEQDAA